MCCITFPFCHLYPASFVLICYTLSLKAHTLQGYHRAVTVHFFNNNFSCSLFIFSFLFESFSSCYIFIVASILPLAPLIGLWNKFRYRMPIFKFFLGCCTFSLKLFDRNNDWQCLCLLPDADFYPQWDCAVCDRAQSSQLLVPNMELILPEDAFLYLIVFWPLKNAFLSDLALSQKAIYIFTTKTLENMLQQDTLWYDVMQFSLGDGDKRGTNIWQMWHCLLEDS